MDENPCYYCGLAADTVDHVVPQSLLDAVRGSGDDALIAAVTRRRRTMVVPACRECNMLAGAKYHETLDERARYVRERLAHRHRKVLSMPDWSPSELAELSANLRSLVIAGLVERDTVRRRLRWRAKGYTNPEASEWWAQDGAA